MAYVEEFRNRLAARNYPKVIELWHEYCGGQDNVDGEEILLILQVFKESDFAKSFGQYVEAILPQAMEIKDDEVKLEVLKVIFDLQTTNSQTLYNIALDILKTHFSEDPAYSQKLKLVGMRTPENFQGVLSNFILLNHIQKGNFVLHTAGWGVGEIVDFSFLREQISIEFENLQGGKRDISFKNAFKTVIPIAKQHFFARRFADADQLEEDARKEPVEVVRSLLKDLGPKTASEIKDLMTDGVIADEEYSKWWQSARAKIKKDPLIESPDNSKLPFFIRKGSASFQDRVQKAFKGKTKPQAIISAAHTLVRDFPEVLKDADAKSQVVAKIKELLSKKLPHPEYIQCLLLLEEPLAALEQKEALPALLKTLSLAEIEATIKEMDVVAFKKRLLSVIETIRQDWLEIFSHLLFKADPNQIKDFLFKELAESQSPEFMSKLLDELIKHPKKHPEAVVWYFQKIIEKDDDIFCDPEGESKFFEAFLIMYSDLDSKPEYRDLSKKMYAILTDNRFEVIRYFLKIAPLEFAHEFLLLASKCRGFSDHDQKILQSLAEVNHPGLAKKSKSPSIDPHVIWTTKDGYMRTHQRIQHIGTVEMINNAKEIEEARAHGDLRENAQYKAALERRSRLQSELKMLSDQFRHARIITKDDIIIDSVGIGMRVNLTDANGKTSQITILGPWDADPENSILSFQSKFVQAMLGKKVGETFMFKTDQYTITDLNSYSVL